LPAPGRPGLWHHSIRRRRRHLHRGRHRRGQRGPPPRRPLPRLRPAPPRTGNSLPGCSAPANRGRRARGAASPPISRAAQRRGSRYLRLVEAEKMLSPFCGFGIDAVMLKDYGQVKSLLARGPLKRLPRHAPYGPRRHHEDIPSYLIRKRPTAGCERGLGAFRVGERGAWSAGPTPGARCSTRGRPRSPRSARSLLRLRLPLLPLRRGPAGSDPPPDLEHHHLAFVANFPRSGRASTRTSRAPSIT